VSILETALAQAPGGGITLAVAVLTAAAAVAVLLARAVGEPRTGREPALEPLGRFVDNITSSLLILDGEGNYRFANRAAGDIFGLDREEIIGRHVSEVEHPARMPLLLAVDVLAHAERPVITGRFQVNARMVVSEFSRLEDDAGGYAGVVALTRDTTDECEFCGHMVRTERMAVLGELAAALAHEINSPLGGVMESVRIIQRNKDDAEKIERFLPLARKGLEQIAATVKQMLKFAAPQEAPHRPIVLEDVVKQCADFLSYRQAESGAELDLDLATGRTVVYVSASITQVLINLVNNAFDAVMEKERGFIRVRTEFLPASAEVMVQVIDNGPGIPPHLRARIFEPFFTTKASGRGTGLGLSVSARIAARNGGRIVVSDAAGGGAVMSLILPVGGAGPESEDVESG